MLWLLAAALIIVGLLGTILPGLPGPIVVFAGILVGAWAGGFQQIGIPVLVLCGVLTAAAYVVDLAMAAAGARRAGASKRAMVGAGLGALVGLFAGLPGLLIGPFVGALLGELTARRGWRHAGRAGAAAWVGFVVGNVFKIALVVAMVGIAVGAMFWR